MESSGHVYALGLKLNIEFRFLVVTIYACVSLLGYKCCFFLSTGTTQPWRLFSHKLHCKTIAISETDHQN